MQCEKSAPCLCFPAVQCVSTSLAERPHCSIPILIRVIVQRENNVVAHLHTKLSHKGTKEKLRRSKDINALKRSLNERGMYVSLYLKKELKYIKTTKRASGGL